MSAGTTGVSATCMRSKVNRCLTMGMEMCRGVRGCSTSASLTLRLFMMPRFRLRRSSAWVGKSLCFRSARARSSVSAGSDAVAMNASADVLRSLGQRSVTGFRSRASRGWIVERHEFVSASQPSREAVPECSPGRKPWVKPRTWRAPKERKNSGAKARPTFHSLAGTTSVVPLPILPNQYRSTPILLRPCEPAPARPGPAQSQWD